MKLNNLLVQFIPIFIIVFFFLYTKHAIKLSHTTIGKLISICIIVFYTIQDVYHGGLICAIIILYYLLTQPQHHCHKECKCNKENFSSNDIHESAKTTFRNNHCVNDKLKYKNMNVKPDYADMVFEEISFTNKPCDPCSKTCSFSIIEEKIKKEDELIKPKDSNDGWLSLATATHSDDYLQEPLEFEGDLHTNIYSEYE